MPHPRTRGEATGHRSLPSRPRVRRKPGGKHHAVRGRDPSPTPEGGACELHRHDLFDADEENHIGLPPPARHRRTSPVSARGGSPILQSSMKAVKQTRPAGEIHGQDLGPFGHPRTRGRSDPAGIDGGGANQTPTRGGIADGVVIVSFRAQPIRPGEDRHPWCRARRARRPAHLRGGDPRPTTTSSRSRRFRPSARGKTGYGGTSSTETCVPPTCAGKTRPQDVRTKPASPPPTLAGKTPARIETNDPSNAPLTSGGQPSVTPSPRARAPPRTGGGKITIEDHGRSQSDAPPTHAGGRPRIGMSVVHIRRRRAREPASSCPPTRAGEDQRSCRCATRPQRLAPEGEGEPCQTQKHNGFPACFRQKRAGLPTSP